MKFRSLTSHPRIYQLWQAPFARKKLAPLSRNNPGLSPRVILDVGCGPGTNFADLPQPRHGYYGLDLSEPYLRRAARAHPAAILRVGDAADADAYRHLPSVDCALMNSLLHHLDDGQARAVLANVRTVLADDGRLHVIDLVLPRECGPSRWLARSDRGAYPRSRAAWLHLLTEGFETEVLEDYVIGIGPIELWRLFYWRGRKSGDRPGDAAPARSTVS